MDELSNVEIIDVSPSPEDRDLQRQLEEGGKVKAMIESPGWKEVIRPFLVRQRENTLESVKSASELNQFFQIQQRVRVIDELLNYIETKLVEGKRAEEKESE